MQVFHRGLGFFLGGLLLFPLFEPAGFVFACACRFLSCSTIDGDALLLVLVVLVLLSSQTSSIVMVFAA